MSWESGGFAQEPILTAKKVSKGPVLDGKVDALWKEAKAVKIPVSGGANLSNGTTEVTLKVRPSARRMAEDGRAAADKK